MNSPREDGQPLPPIRAMVFRDRPDFILFHVREGGALVVPRLESPFVRADVSKALAAAGVDYRMSESVAGRFGGVMRAVLEGERGERKQRQKEHEATLAYFERSGTPASRDRAALRVRKEEVDATIRELKRWLAEARSRAYTTGQRDPDYRTKERELASLQTESLALQGRLGALRREENKRSQGDWLEVFKKMARRHLSSEVYEELVQVTNAEVASRDDVADERSNDEAEPELAELARSLRRHDRAKLVADRKAEDVELVRDVQAREHRAREAAQQAECEVAGLTAEEMFVRKVHHTIKKRDGETGGES